MADLGTQEEPESKNEEAIRVEIPRPVIEVMDRLEKAGFQAYLVGGSVRDMLLGREPKDYDIATDATPDQVKPLFPKVIPAGEKYGTVTVLNGIPIEVTTFRKDGRYLDGRRPESVDFSDSLEEDVKRRDFTINALAMTKEGVLKDPLDVQRDIWLEHIHCVGDPNERFNEDALRMMRAIRFACQLGFSISAPTYYAIRRNARLISNVSWERIRDELAKILLSERPCMGISLLGTSRLMQYIIPELSDCVGFDQHSEHHDKNVMAHIIETVGWTPNRLNVRLAALLHDVAKPKTFTLVDGEGHFYGHHLEGEIMAREILNRLRFDNHTIGTVCTLVREHMSRYDFLRPRNTKRFINRVGIDNLEDLFDLQIADIKASAPPHDFSMVLALKEDCQRILNEKEPLTVKDLAINGHDLCEWGMTPGKEMGAMLKRMLECVLEDPSVNTREGLKKVFEGGFQ
jgi:tRNA nucleotidyltransferase (CCA-adding enzyme)